MDVLRDWGKAFVRRLLAQLGLRARRFPVGEVSVVDVRDKANHPEAIWYWGAQTTQSVLIEAPVARMCSIEAFPLDPDGPHPFVRAVVDARSCEDSLEAIRQRLAAYYRAVQPRNAVEWLGIDAREAPLLAEQPCWARLLPWDADTLVGRRREARAMARAESARFGTGLSLEHGWKLCGPVSPSLLERQSQRLDSLYRSIGIHGLTRRDELDGDIRAIVLVNSDGDWNLLQCGGGFHRAAVACALGSRSLSLRVWRVIHRDHVDLWPQVSRGIISRSGALAIFDRMFAATPPPVAAAWSTQVRRSDAPEFAEGQR